MLLSPAGSLLTYLHGLMNTLRYVSKLKRNYPPTNRSQCHTLMTNSGLQLMQHPIHLHGATLHIKREGRIQASGYFSAKVKSHKGRWLPCEIEALAISSAIKHFAPFITQFAKQCLLTDSKPCVQAFNKLYHGEFSSSQRLSAFFFTVLQYNVRLLHICGSANIPSYFASRNAPNCSADEW